MRIYPKFTRPNPKSIFCCHNSKGIKPITRLCLGLSHLREHKFKHSFQKCLNPICTCGCEIETTTHFLLHCPIYANERMTLLDKIRNINTTILEQNDSLITKD